MGKHLLMDHLVQVSFEAELAAERLRGMVGNIIRIERFGKYEFIEINVLGKKYHSLDSSELLMLNHPTQIRYAVNKIKKQLSVAHVRHISKIVRLVELGDEEAAMKLVLRNEVYRSICLTSCLLWQQTHQQKQKLKKRLRRK